MCMYGLLLPVLALLMTKRFVLVLAQQAAVLAMGSNGKSLREQFEWLFNTVAKEDTPTEVRLWAGCQLGTTFGCKMSEAVRALLWSWSA